MKPESKLDTQAKLAVTVRPLLESDLDAADGIMRLAFGTFIGLPDPTQFMGDADFVRTRWRANPHAAFAAEIDGRVIGSNFATNWGSVGFFGPLTVHPEFWDRGVAKRLMAPALHCFDEWGTTHAGLFTFPHSQKHVGLYQRFGFWPRFLTMLMAKDVAISNSDARWTRFSELQSKDRAPVLAACRNVTDSIYGGLDLTNEIEALAHQNLGDTVLLWDGDVVAGLAVCHVGAGSEAGSGTCYIQFGGVRPGETADHNFADLLHVCEQFAASHNLARLLAGVNTARHEAYSRMLAGGFVTNMQGVVMSKPNEPGYNRPGVYLIDDWR